MSKRERKRRWKAIMAELSLADMFSGEIVEDRICELENELVELAQKKRRVLRQRKNKGIGVVNRCNASSEGCGRTDPPRPEK